jgi:hypothetical protein
MLGDDSIVVEKPDGDRLEVKVGRMGGYGNDVFFHGSAAGGHRLDMCGTPELAARWFGERLGGYVAETTLDIPELAPEELHQLIIAKDRDTIRPVFDGRSRL